MTPDQQQRGAALRVTGPRLAVLTEVRAHPHADVDTLTAKVRSRLGSVSTQAGQRNTPPRPSRTPA